MPDRERISLTPEPLRGSDIFPDISDEIDRRIAHSEQRLKTWVLAGVAANLLVAIMAAIPTIFYMGQISRDINTALAQQATMEARIVKLDEWANRRMIWSAKMQAALKEKGISVDVPDGDMP